MKQILYIAYYDYENYHDCISISEQLRDNNNNINVLHIFLNQQISSIYYRYCHIKNKNYIKCLDKKTHKLSQTISEYKNLYQSFYFLKTTKLIFEEKNIPVILATDKPTYNKDIGYICSLENIVNLDKQDVLYEDIFTQNIDQYCVIGETKNLGIINVKEIIINQQEDIQKPSAAPIVFNVQNNVYYEDSNCLFAILESRAFGLIKSPAYFNKNNQKIYSVNNNCLGNVIKYSNNSISIEWTINGQKFTASYYKDHNNIYL